MRIASVEAGIGDPDREATARRSLLPTGDGVAGYNAAGRFLGC
jgi:hypothetical protein